MLLYTFQSEQFVKNLIESGTGRCDTQFMSEVSAYKYSTFLYDYLESRGIELGDSAPIWCFANYPSQPELKLGEAVLHHYFNLLCWYKLHDRYLVEIEVDNDFGIFLYDTFKYEDEYKINDFNKMDKSRVIAKVLPYIQRSQVRGIYSFTKAKVSDFTPSLLFTHTDKPAEYLQSCVRHYVSRFKRCNELLFDLSKYRKVSILYSNSGLIAKPYIFDIDHSVDIDLLKENNYIK